MQLSVFSMRLQFYIGFSFLSTDNVTTATEVIVAQSTQLQMESTTSVLPPVITSMDPVPSTHAVSTSPLALSSLPGSLEGACCACVLYVLTYAIAELKHVCI